MYCSQAGHTNLPISHYHSSYDRDTPTLKIEIRSTNIHGRSTLHAPVPTPASTIGPDARQHRHSQPKQAYNIDTNVQQTVSYVQYNLQPNVHSNQI
mmetsp:Transcript_14990/g.26047  ORF Transcript_14990/g.26047 Transcript_14990/m.26047 type:complete len:96 (+) Transcript_14990:135-422(+)